VLSGNNTLQKLGMRYCEIGKSGFITLAKIISTNSSITYLDVSHNSLDSTEACKQLAAALGHAKTRKGDKISATVINELNISNCLIGPKQLDELAEGLVRNRSIKTLHLDDNELGIKGMRALSVAVKQNQVLKIITVQDTHISTSDVVVFMEKAADECFIEVLDCRKNGIDAGNSQFVQAQKRYNKYKILL